MTMTIEQLAALAAQSEDQTKVTKGGDYEYTPPAEGLTVARLVEYIEIGKQPQKPYLGKPKPDAEEVYIGFELLHPKKNIKEVEVEGGKKLVADYIRLKVSKKLGEKARFKKLFNKLQYGRSDKQHIAQMLGEAFIVTVVHAKSADGTKTYANLEKDGEYLIEAPFRIDPLTEEKKAVQVPANIRPLKIFLWDHPNKETWDSLFIDGTRTNKNDKGEDVETSNNWLQERILSATNYGGSRLEAVLNEVGDLSITEDKNPGNAESTSTTKSLSEAETALAELDAKKEEVSGAATASEIDALGL